MSSANAFYQRLEYRSAHGDERPLVRTLAVYCRACVEREVRRAHGIADGQGQLV